MNILKVVLLRGQGPLMDNWRFRSLVYDFRSILNENMALYGGFNQNCGTNWLANWAYCLKKLKHPGPSSQIVCKHVLQFCWPKQKYTHKHFQYKNGLSPCPGMADGCHTNTPGFEPKATMHVWSSIRGKLTASLHLKMDGLEYQFPFLEWPILKRKSSTQLEQKPWWLSMKYCLFNRDPDNGFS